VGRLEQGIAQAKATAPIKINIAGAEAAARTAAQNPVADLDKYVYTTATGQKYINQADLGKNRQAAAQAVQNGIPVVDAATHDILTQVDNARANLNYMMTAIQGKLATDPTGRLFKGPSNTIQALAQTDPSLAAVGTYRTAAIQALRAVAGSKNLRINQAEIQAAQDNDIPKVTDTLPVAQQKLQNMNAFMTNVENAHLQRNRSVSIPTGGGASAPTTSQPEAQGGFKIGGTYGDKKYLGGDPKQPASWQ
jgi:hypothetical protein